MGRVTLITRAYKPGESCRVDLVREPTPWRVYCPMGGYRCAHCGQVPGSHRLYRYGDWRMDAGARIDWHKGMYCSKACHDANN